MNTHIKRRKDKIAKLFPRLGEHQGVPYIQYNENDYWVSLRTGIPIIRGNSSMINVLSVGDSVKLTQQ